MVGLYIIMIIHLTAIALGLEFRIHVRPTDHSCCPGTCPVGLMIASMSWDFRNPRSLEVKELVTSVANGMAAVELRRRRLEVGFIHYDERGLLR